jgi:hypothetical protein
MIWFALGILTALVLYVGAASLLGRFLRNRGGGR